MEALDWKEYTEFAEDENRNQLEFACDEAVMKHGYGLPVENSRVLRTYSRTEVVIEVMGCDADACVMASCFRLWDADYRFMILSDYVFPTAEAAHGFSRENVIAMMKRNFGKCVCNDKQISNI